MKIRKKIISVILVCVMTILSFGNFTNTREVIAAENNSVTIHFKTTWDAANIFYWNQNGSYNNPVRNHGNERRMVVCKR